VLIYQRLDGCNCLVRIAGIILDHKLEFAPVDATVIIDVLVDRNGARRRLAKEPLEPLSGPNMPILMRSFVTPVVSAALAPPAGLTSAKR
jgi:hypothetical protein